MADYLIKELAKMAKLNQLISPLYNKCVKKKKKHFYKATFRKIKGRNTIKEQTRYIKQDMKRQYKQTIIDVNREFRYPFRRILSQDIRHVRSDLLEMNLTD